MQTNDAQCTGFVSDAYNNFPNTSLRSSKSKLSAQRSFLHLILITFQKMIPSAVSSMKMERNGKGSNKPLTCCTLLEHQLGGVAGDSREALTLASSGDMKFEREIALECEK